jgi:protein-L-isoaspartate(D-aspartate) O-methyltransferase
LSEQKWEELIQKLIRSGVLKTPQVISAMRNVPRENFLPENMRVHAATDCPIQIGSGQTASAPLS